MKDYLIYGMQFPLCLFFFCLLTGTQFPDSPEPALSSRAFLEKGLFETDEVLEISLKGNLKQLMNDRSNNPKNHSLTLSYKNADSLNISIPVEMKTRGHFRKQKGVCTYPPLLIQFKNDDVLQSSVFRDQKKLKLVMPCKGDEYVIREWLVYKIYNLVTPRSFRARLVKVKLEDPKNKKTVAPFYGMLLEEESQVAKRNNMISIERKLRPEHTQTDAFLTMAVFQYLIGNTDWSVQYLQNIKLLATDSIALAVTVPYDFDHAGIVNAPYAQPAEQLLMTSVRQRRYRGYCMQDMKMFDEVIARYMSLKNDICNLYTSCTLLDARYIKSTVQYLEEFYETIKNAKSWQKEFAYPCDKNGTGNVVIKGLKQD